MRPMQQRWEEQTLGSHRGKDHGPGGEGLKIFIVLLAVIAVSISFKAVMVPWVRGAFTTVNSRQ